ncbi:unnamed protein product [Owenia fusiformis]|uniref:Uncharacterized protein n=1 Tax=Owenia fusiformis TaxID=6347 RepID=A0A8J1XWD1_OWEFU|nr:unnamed protein product [Owenia fusiformis]
MAYNWSEIMISGLDRRTSCVIFVYYILISVLIILSNVMVVIAFIKTPKLRTLTNTFILNLAASDILVGVHLICCAYLEYWVSYSYHSDHWDCLFCGFTVTLSFGVSLFTLMAISAERFIKIIYPMHYFMYVTKNRIIVTMVSIWVFFLAVGSAILYWNRWYHGIRCMILDIQPRAGFYGMILPLVVSPIGIILILYAKIFHVARKQRKAIEKQSYLNQGELENVKKEGSKTFMMFLLIGWITVAWTPFMLTALARIITEDVTGDLMVFQKIGWIFTMEHIFHGLVYTNSFVNPVIYGWKSLEWRNAFKSVLCMSSQNKVDPWSQSDSK